MKSGHGRLCEKDKFMNEMNYMSAALEFFAATITGVMLIGCFAERSYKDTTGKLLICFLTANMLMLLVDAPICLLLDEPSPEKVPAIKVLSFFSDAFACTLVSLYAYCATAYISTKKKISYRYAHIITAFCAAAVISFLISAFNGMYVSYDETGRDIPGPLFLVSQLIYVILPALTMALAIVNRKTLGRRDTIVFVLFGAIPVVMIPVQIFWNVVPVYLASTVSMTFLYTSIHILQVQNAAEMEKKLVEQELALSESRNALVLSQIQPHFLYNALTSIYRLCDVKPEAAKEAVSDFSKYLRGNLNSIKKTNLISFAEELNHTKAYLSLEKIRFDDELEIRYDISVSEFFIPPMTIEPLVENAVNHGISDLPDGGCVTISTAEFPDFYEIRVSDNGVGFDPNNLPNDGKLHIGISSVRSRLQIMCSGTLDFISSENSGTTAIIKIPKGAE